MDIFDEMAREIEEIGRKWHSVLDHPPADAMLPARWSYSGGALCWHVVLGDEVPESDVDIEITSAAIIVRVRPPREKPRFLLGLLPVPRTFNVREPEIRLESHTMEIYLQRLGEGGR